MQHQKRIKGYRRERLNAAVLREIRDKVERIALQHDVSKSFVIAVALAKVFGIEKQEKYR